FWQDFIRFFKKRNPHNQSGGGEKMRKGMAVMLSAALAGCLWGCNGEGENAEEVSLYAQGMDVIRLMQEMSQSEEYAGFISGSPELQDKILEMGQGDYIAPKMVYQIWPDGD